VDEGRSVRIFYIIACAFIFSSCGTALLDIPKEQGTGTKGEVNMPTNVAPSKGTAIRLSGTKTENIQPISNIIDNNLGTMFGYTYSYASDEPVFRETITAVYQINLNSEYYIDDVKVNNYYIMGDGTQAGCGSVLFISNNIGVDAILPEGSLKHLGDITMGEIPYPFVADQETDFLVGEKIIGIRLSILIDYHKVFSGIGSITSVIKEIAINGNDHIDSEIKIHGITGTTTFKKNETLYGPLRYKAPSGIESLVLVNPSSSAASNVRIMTPSGVKAIAKL